MKGYTLIEVIVFIIVLSLSISLLLPFFFAARFVTTNTQFTKAQQFAQARMELILSQRMTNGFTSFQDPCESGYTGTVPTMCSIPTGEGYNVSSTITTDPDSKGTDYKQITVTVSGEGSATYTTLVTNYES